MRDDIISLMRGRWTDALELSGLSDRTLSGKHGPCPLCCDGSDRFRYDDKDGRGTYFCNVCGAGDGMTLLRGVRGESFADTAEWLRSVVLGERPNTPFPAQRVSVAPPKEVKGQSSDETAAYLKKLWNEGVAVTKGDPVWRYITETRGYPMDLDFFAPNRVRLHPGLDYFVEERIDAQVKFKKIARSPVMMWAVRNPDGRGVAIHRTWITQDGRKLPLPEGCSNKKLTKSLGIAGGAIPMMRPEEVLGVAEGLESALGGHMLKGIPVWPCVSSTILAKFQPPPMVRKLIIFADNDPVVRDVSAGIDAALELRDRATSAGIEVRIILPEVEGEDADDMWKQLKLKQ